MKLKKAQRRPASKKGAEPLLRTPESKPSRLRWPESRVVLLSLSLLVGTLYALLLVGPGPINPTNISWLTKDGAMNYIGWAMLRLDPQFHWPLTLTHWISYPQGTSVAFLDVNPVLAILFKPFSALLPTPFQYFGLGIVLACALQFFFASNLIRLFLGREFWPVFLSSLFFLLAPPFTWRVTRHFALGNHWVILAALVLFVRLQRPAVQLIRGIPISPLAWSMLLESVALSIHVYLGLMVAIILTTSFVFALCTQKVSWRAALISFAALAFTLLLTGVALGYARSGGGYVGEGYRLYSLNLLAPINPLQFHSILLPTLPLRSGQYEGYNYFGLGVILLCVSLLPYFAKRLAGDQSLRRKVLLSTLWCLIVTALAASTQITFGSHVLLDLDPQQHLTQYLGIFRASGRLFWMPYYVILATILVSVFRWWRPYISLVVITGALLLQSADTVTLRRSLMAESSSSDPIHLTSPVWSRMGVAHRNLIVLPPRQCGPNLTPGGDNAFRTFGFLAEANNMRINSFYAARYSNSDLLFVCGKATDELLSRPLARDSVFIVSRPIASLISTKAQGTNPCHQVDGFSVCSPDLDFGDSPTLPVDTPLLPSSGSLPSWSDPHVTDFFVYGWNVVEPWGIWSAGDSLLQFRLNRTQIDILHHLKLNLRLLIGPKPIHYELRCDGYSVSGDFPGGLTSRLEKFTRQLPIAPSIDGVHSVVFLTKDAVQPNAISTNQDNRILGLGVSQLTLTP